MMKMLWLSITPIVIIERDFIVNSANEYLVGHVVSDILR